MHVACMCASSMISAYVFMYVCMYVCVVFAVGLDHGLGAESGWRAAALELHGLLSQVLGRAPFRR